LPPKLRREIGEVAEKLDYYNYVASDRDRAKAASANRILISVFLVFLGLATLFLSILITVLVIFGAVFLALSVWSIVSYSKNKATAGRKQIEAYSWWSSINKQVETLANEAYNELSTLHEARVRPTVKHVIVDFAGIMKAAKGKGLILTSIECPHCSGAVEIPSTGEYFECQYCGKTIHATKIFDKLKDILT